MTAKYDWPEINKQQAADIITGKDQAEYAARYAEYVFTRVNTHLAYARGILDAAIVERDGDRYLSPYMRAYRHIVRALELEPSPFSTSASDALTALFWDLKGIRVAMEQVKGSRAIIDLINNLIGVADTGGEF